MINLDYDEVPLFGRDFKVILVNLDKSKQNFFIRTNNCVKMYGKCTKMDNLSPLEGQII